MARIAEVAKAKPKEQFTSLAHLINEELLEICHHEMDPNKASGIDHVTKEKYGDNLTPKLRDLVLQMKQHAYHPQPVKRVYIPKQGTNELRPLGILAYEDKLVQAALSKILNAIYEADFLECSFGFRPNRGCHDALKVLNHIVEKGKISYIVDADIKGFFDHVDHQSLLKFIGHRIKDPNIHQLIVRILKSGGMYKGEFFYTTEGTPQGGVVSPILGNIYLHYALDLWFEKVVRKHCRGEAYMVRYCDDFVCCFQYKTDAERFYLALIQRLKKFNLEIAEEKTKIIEFGRFARTQCKKHGKTKPETFDFLGFTHYCSQGQNGQFRMKRKTSRKKFKASLLRCKEWIKFRRNWPAKDLIDELTVKLNGYYRYYGITDNSSMIELFYYKTTQILFKWLNRRSQRKSFGWDKFILFLQRHPLPRPKIYVNIYHKKAGFGYIGE